jgi:hypothetical protein
MKNLFLMLIPTLLVFGGFAWTMLVGARAQKDADQFVQDWVKSNNPGKRH